MVGDNKTKLADLGEIASSLRAQSSALDQLSDLSICELRTLDVERVTDALWNVISKMRVGVGRTLLVVNSKTLHHLLPELMPPIDSEYTLSFFFDFKGTQLGPDGGEAHFRAIFPKICEVARAKRTAIRRRLGKYMSTSESEVIDNAIVGWVRRRDSLA